MKDRWMPQQESHDLVYCNTVPNPLIKKMQFKKFCGWTCLCQRLKEMWIFFQPHPGDFPLLPFLQIKQIIPLLKQKVGN